MSARQSLLGADTKPTFMWMPTFRSTGEGRQYRVDSLAQFSGVPFSLQDLMVLDAWLDAEGSIPRDAAAGLVATLGWRGIRGFPKREGG